MTRAGDYSDEMPPRRQIDDATAEALLTGRSVPDDLEPLVRVLRAYREVADQPVRPSAALAAQMAAGVFPGTAEHPCMVLGDSNSRGGAAPVRGRKLRMAVTTALATVAAKAAGLSVAAKASAGLAIAVAGVGTTGFAGVLPEPVQERFDTVVESVIEPQAPTEGQPGENAEFGERVSEDAKDGGVDGGEISEEARRRGDRQRPADRPGAPVDPSDLPTPDRTPDAGRDAGPGSAPTDPGSQRRTAPPAAPSRP